MDSNYQTPQRTPKSRRKAATTPQSASVYSSPYQILELTPNTNDVDGMKKTLLEQDGIIQQLLGDVKDLKTQQAEKMDESILIESSNKISITEKRVHDRDVAMLTEELMKQKELVRSVRKEKDDETRSRTIQQSKLRQSENEICDLKAQIDFLENRISDLETKIFEQSEKIGGNKREIRDLQDALSTANHQKKVTEELLKQERNHVKELKRQIEMITRSLEESRKRELELNVQLEGQSQARRSAEQALEQLKMDESKEIMREIQTISTHLITIPQSPRLNEGLAFEQVGALRNTVEYKDREIQRLKAKEKDVQQQLEEEKQRRRSAEEEIKTLRKELLESDDNIVATALIKETDKLKEQKAEIRCELLRQQKENKRLLSKIEEMETGTVQSSSAEVQSLTIENTLLSEKISSLQKKLEIVEDNLRKKEEEIQEIGVDKEEKAQLKKMRDGLEAANEELKNYLDLLDKQCEQYKERRQRAETAAQRAQEEVAELREKFRQAEKDTEGVRASEALVSQLKVENDRLETKISYLKEELNECHSDYREELARMAREISDSKRKARDEQQQAEGNINVHIVADLKKQIGQHESQMRATKRQVEELKRDNEKLQAQVSEVLTKEKTSNNENAKLRQGISDSIAKLEQYKRELGDQKALNSDLAEKVGEYEEKITKLKDEVMELEDTLDEKESLISYLQSQINVKQVPKVGRRSTLLKTISDVSITPSTVDSPDSADMEEVMELENQLTKLKKERDEKKQMLNERRNTPPSLQPFKTPHPPMREVQNLPSTPISIPKSSAGIMRHDIPHKWKDLRNFSVYSRKCAVCFIGMPTFGKTRKCGHCGVVVHYQCSRRVVNTCGLPDECANFYMESQAPVGRMNGWIRIFRDDTDSKTWDSCWALMDDRSICFYDKESAKDDLSRPLLRLDLWNENFLVRAGSVAPSNAEACTQAASIIQLKFAKMSIYILAPSIQSAKRWTEALQAAQTRRMALTRKPSSFSEQSCLLTLNAPNNLTVHTTAVVEDCLLLGAKAGLFFTHLSSPRMPIRFSGVDSVLCMEVMPEINTVALITGQHKNLSIIPLSTLRSQLNSAQPALRLDVLSGLSHLHLLDYHQQDTQKYLFVADTVKLHILKYNTNRDVFVHFHSIETGEPPMCLQSTPSGFYFGSDSFYRVDFSGMTPRAVSLVEEHVADYPVGILNIGDDELLFAYQNYGIFVNPRGDRTREQVVEWEQMPMEFVYTAPFLYVIHYDSIEIMQIAENLGQGKGQKTILDEREVFTCQNAHIVGNRPNGDIFVSITSKDSTEIHKFNATQQRRTMKRRGISLSHFASSNQDKRSKTLA